MSWRNDFRKLSARSWRDRGLLFEAFLWLGLMRAAILVLPFRLISRLLGMENGKEAANPDPDLMNVASGVCWALQAASARTPWQSTCLVQALAGSTLLLRHRIPATLCLGVAKDATAREGMIAHAWLRCGDTIVVGGDTHRFAILSTFAVP